MSRLSIASLSARITLGRMSGSVHITKSEDTVDPCEGITYGDVYFLSLSLIGSIVFLVKAVSMLS